MSALRLDLVVGVLLGFGIPAGGAAAAVALVTFLLGRPTRDVKLAAAVAAVVVTVGILAFALWTTANPPSD
jgi:uncharacterized membrane protein YadS